MILYNKQINNRGYTLLFAVLVSSLVLAVGISILNIAKKEFLIATSTRDSTAALYAADSGLECAIYANDTNDTFNRNGQNTGNLGCNNTVGSVVSNLNGEPKTFVFHARFGTEGTSCAVVTVTKSIVNSNQIKTTIESRGYNTGWNTTTDKTCDLPSAKRVERALRYSSL